MEETALMIAPLAMRYMGQALISAASPHLDSRSHLANHVACVRADHAAAENFVVAVGFWAVVKQQLGHTNVREQTF